MAQLQPDAATLGHLTNVLRASLGDSNQARVQATKELESLGERVGYSLCLLQLLATPELANDLPLKQAASIAFKRFVLQNWDYASTVRAENELPDPLTAESRGAIKQHLVALMVSQPKLIQAQLGQALAIISSHDFPKQWPTLLPELIARFTDASIDARPDELVGLLEVMHSIFYRYRVELKSQALWEEIKIVIDNVCEPLRVLFLKWCARLSDPAIAANAALLPTVVHVVQLIAELFHSLSAQDIPAGFEEPVVLREWMQRFIELMQFNPPLLEEIAKKRADTDEPTKLDQLKAAICDIINLYTWKYEDQFSEFVPGFVQCIFSVLSSLGGERRYDLLVGHAVRFLTAVVRKSQFQGLFASEAALNTLAEKVLVPQLRLRDSDLEQFDMNPQEYIRVDIEGSDADTRRRNTVDLINGLVAAFEGPVSAILKRFVDALLSEYAANKKSDKGMLAKDCAMYITLALSAKSRSATKGVTQVNANVDVGAFLQTHVLPELQGDITEHPVLKADCLKFLTIFRTQLPAATYSLLFPLIIRFLGSEHVVLHSYAAFAIERMLAVKEANGSMRVDKALLQPHLQSMLVGLFGALGHDESKENEYLMKAIMRVCSVGQDAMVPFAQTIIAKATAILTYVSANPKNPKFNHSLFETIAALVKYLCKSNAALVDAFESALLPPFQSVLSTETAADFGPYVFQILAQLLELRADVSAPYQAIFPAMLAPGTWSNTGNVPAVTRLLCAYLHKPSTYATLLQGTNRLEGVLGVFAKLLAARSTEAHALELLTSLMCGSIELSALQPYLPAIFNKNLFPKLQPSAKPAPTPRLLKATSLFLLTLVARHGFDTINALLSSVVQPGILAMLLGAVILPHLSYFVAEQERRVAALTLTTLLTRTPGFLTDPSFAPLWPRAFAGAVLLVAPRASREVSQAALAGTEGEADGPAEDPEDLLVQAEKTFQTAYARLVFAGAAEPNYFPAVPAAQSAKEFFAQSVEHFCAQQPGQAPQRIATLSAEEQGKIKAFCEENKINLR